MHFIHLKPRTINLLRQVKPIPKYVYYGESIYYFYLKFYEDDY